MLKFKVFRAYLTTLLRTVRCKSLQPYSRVCLPPYWRDVPLINNSQAFDASMENVWPQTIEFFAERSLPISVIERDSGLITVNDARISMMELSIWADCGKQPLYQPTNNRLDLSTRVRESSAESTSVIVTTNYQVYWYDSFSNSGFWKACTSRGLLESALFGWIGARIGIFDR